MTTTSDMRKAWSPPCRGPWARIELHGEGVITIRKQAEAAFLTLNDCLIRHDYRTRSQDTGAYNCRQITGGSGYSLHAYGIAVDINWMTNPYSHVLHTDMPPAMIRDIEAIRTNSGHTVFRWGGRYDGNKDAMHFEIICTPAQLASGIATTSTPTQPVPPVELPSQIDPKGADMYIVVAGAGIFAQFGNVTIKLNISFAEFAELVNHDDSVPVMRLPESAKDDWFTRAIQQTKVATGT
jgi:hypothetical protein